MEASKLIFIYKQSCDKVVIKWLEDYFDAEYFDYTWVSYYGGVFQFADYYIDMNSILECYEHKVTKEDFFKWYESSLEQLTDLSLSDFTLLPEKREEARQKHLEDLRERVKMAEKEFKQAILEYDTKI
jgi:hypothetical protein